MINPSVYDRYDVETLNDEYNKIITESGLLAKHNKHYDEHFLLVNNAVDAPVPQEIVVPGGRYRPRSRKSSKMLKTTRRGKSSKNVRSRIANKSKRSHNKH
jgi:hypothetical protein